MHLSATRGIIALFVKLGKDALFLGNWRPLTLLNCDYKIHAKILAIRLNTVLPKLIHPMQTGFINNRNIAENIFSLIKVIDHCNKEKIPAVILSFDFQKAFDSVEWSVIRSIMETMNFGPVFIEAVTTRNNYIYRCASNDGFWLSWFKVTRSCSQGCPLSPLIFDLVVEVIGARLRQNKDIRGTMSF